MQRGRGKTGRARRHRTLCIDRETPDPLSVLTIERLTIRRAISLVRRAATGSLERVRGLSVERGVSEFSIDADDTVQVQMDGEHYGPVSHLVALARPDSLRIAVPPAQPD